METSLNLRYCPESVLDNLPENMEIRGNLSLSTKITSLPRGLKIEGGLDLGGCYSLESLPEDLKIGWYLSLVNCFNLESLPQGLKVGKEIYIPQSGIDPQSVPEHLKDKIMY